MMKLGVYAICKNEIENIRFWLECAKEADEAVIVDTGSTDGTWEVLQKSGIRCIKKIFSQFRFDDARNYALSLLPEDCDICLPLDPDMVISKGYCEALKKAWNANLGVLYIPMRYTQSNYVETHFCHSRKRCKWVYPTYEQLRFTGDEAKYDGVTIDHNYRYGRTAHYMIVGLAKLGMEENPNNPYCKAVYERSLKEYGRLSGTCEAAPTNESVTV